MASGVVVDWMMGLVRLMNWFTSMVDWDMVMGLWLKVMAP